MKYLYNMTEISWIRLVTYTVFKLRYQEKDNVECQYQMLEMYSYYQQALVHTYTNFRRNININVWARFYNIEMSYFSLNVGNASRSNSQPKSTRIDKHESMAFLWIHDTFRTRSDKDRTHLKSYKNKDWIFLLFWHKAYINWYTCIIAKSVQSWTKIKWLVLEWSVDIKDILTKFVCFTIDIN